MTRLTRADCGIRLASPGAKTTSSCVGSAETSYKIVVTAPVALSRTGGTCEVQVNILALDDLTLFRDRIRDLKAQLPPLEQKGRTGIRKLPDAGARIAVTVKGCVVEPEEGTLIPVAGEIRRATHEVSIPEGGEALTCRVEVRPLADAEAHTARVTDFWFVLRRTAVVEVSMDADGE